MAHIRRVPLAVQEQIKGLPQYEGFTDVQIAAYRQSVEIGRSASYVYVLTGYSVSDADAISTELWQHVADGYDSIPTNIRGVILEHVDDEGNRAKENTSLPGTVVQDGLIPVILYGQDTAPFTLTDYGLAVS